MGTVWKLYTRGVPSAATRENRRAKDHWDSATKRGYQSILHRYETDRSYRQCLADERVTYERMVRWNEIADPERQRPPPQTIPIAERQRRGYFHWAQDLRGTGGGAHTSRGERRRIPHDPPQRPNETVWLRPRRDVDQWQERGWRSDQQTAGQWQSERQAEGRQRDDEPRRDQWQDRQNAWTGSSGSGHWEHRPWS